MLTSHDNLVHVTFITDFSVNKAGFNMTYHAFDGAFSEQGKAYVGPQDVRRHIFKIVLNMMKNNHLLCLINTKYRESNSLKSLKFNIEKIKIVGHLWTYT